MTSNKKAVELDDIPIGVWKSLWDRGIEWPIKFFNEIIRAK